ncbi:hypothetical protein DXG01_010796 [Tephrocybe rancida]|nr:hypothetical protein DXG01_010796 [Tephrocybe rancida]
MVPIADAFNHTQENHVHIETEFNVCSQCGSLDECPHDVDDGIERLASPAKQRDATHSATWKGFDPYYEMVSNSDIPPGEEIFNTYGETLSNSQLFVQYGFTLDINDNDRIYWELREALAICADRPGFFNVSLAQWEARWKTAVQCASKSGVYARLPESSLIYCQEDDGYSVLCLDGDGKISHQLWTLLALPLCLRADRGSFDDQLSHILADLRALLEFQLLAESVDEADCIQVDFHQPFGLHEVNFMLATLADSVTNLCVARKSQLGKKLSMSGDLNDILDNLPTVMQHTRDALTLVISEQSILDSCVSAWEELV